MRASRTDWRAPAFALSLTLPSAATVERYLGLPGVLVYVVVASVVLVYLHRGVLDALTSAISVKRALGLAAVALVLLVVVFLVGYPIANAGVIGRGSDRDEALNIATTELLGGRYPYYPTPYTGNLITPLPGALILSAPAVLLGNSAYQNLFWLCAFVATAAWLLRDVRAAVLLLLVVLALSPTVLREYVTGGDLLANSIYVLLAVVWLVHLVPDPATGGWRKLLVAVALGLGLAWRANFALLVPVVFSALWQRAGWRAAVGYVTVAGVTAAGVTLPFYFYDPAGFAPLHTAQAFAQFESLFPSAGLMLTAASGLVAVLAALGRSTAHLFGLLERGTIVLAFPVLIVIVLGSIRLGTLDLNASMYGMAPLFFAAIAFWPRRAQAGSNA